MWRKLTGLGMPGVAFYALHVALGGFLWKGYDHLTQPISDLTAAGAPNRSLLSIFTFLYGLLCIAFAFSAFMYARKSAPKIASAGLLVFLAMHLVSISYGLFPEDLPGAAMTLAGTMHIVVTFLIVPLTILAPLLVGAGFWRVDGWKGFGIYSLVTGAVIFLAGGASAVFFAQKLPYFGLVERVNIGSLELWTFLLSLKLFAGRHPLGRPDWEATKRERQSF